MSEETTTAAEAIDTTEAVAPVETTETPEITAETEAVADKAPEITAETEAVAEPEIPAEEEEISYHAVEKDGNIAAIWEMQGLKHLRTIDPRSREGLQILQLFTAEIHETQDTHDTSESVAA